MKTENYSSGDARKKGGFQECCCDFVLLLFLSTEVRKYNRGKENKGDVGGGG